MTLLDDSIDAALITRILGEYREMPGLAVTEAQARRLWGCDAVTCGRVIEVLVTQGHLRWSRKGLLIRTQATIVGARRLERHRRGHHG